MFITVKVNMGQLTAEQSVVVVKNWFVTKSLEQVRQLFRERFPDANLQPGWQFGKMSKIH